MNDDGSNIDDTNENYEKQQYEKVVYKKKVGQFTINYDKLTFVESSNTGGGGNGSTVLSTNNEIVSISYDDIIKHQVSPVTYPKSLLKVIIMQHQSQQQQTVTFQFTNRIELEKVRKSISERLRYNQNKLVQVSSSSVDNNNGTNSKKRQYTELLVSSADGLTTGGNTNGNSIQQSFAIKPSTFGQLDTTAVAVTRSSLLAANGALRKQHNYLVEETQTINEDDFWSTHSHLLEEEYARIAGMARAGQSSLLQSHLPSSGRVTLGVQEMRQIFLLYPAVHRAYEEKVPLELSDEQFWRKYLESEFFHKDRGRIGTTARNHAAMASAAAAVIVSDTTSNTTTTGSKSSSSTTSGAGSSTGNTGSATAATSTTTTTSGTNSQQQQSAAATSQSNSNKKSTGPSYEQQEARAAAVGTDDLFSRYDQKLQDAARRRAAASTSSSEANSSRSNNNGNNNNNNNIDNNDTATVGTNNSIGGDGSTMLLSNGKRTRRWGRNLAIGQFDLASTFETERGKLLEGPKDIHPPNSYMDDNDKGIRVIQKYNRHWALVLHPDQAVAGANLVDVARRSVLDVLPNDTDAQVLGGIDTEMKRLVAYANASDVNCNHAACTGVADDNDSGNDNYNDNINTHMMRHGSKNKNLVGSVSYEPLTLKNIEAYYSGQVRHNIPSTGDPIVDEAKRKQKNEELGKKHSVLAHAMTNKMRVLANTLLVDGSTTSSEGGVNTVQVQQQQQQQGMINESSFPTPELGRELLSALTKKMANDSKAEQAASLEIVKHLSEDFRERLQSYFRRSSELLRHFFGLRKLEMNTTTSSSTTTNTTNQKLAKIVAGMELFYREMEVMRKELPQTDTGEIMRKMCLPIMAQLDWAFKLHSESQSKGLSSSGGFVTVETIF